MLLLLEWLGLGKGLGMVKVSSIVVVSRFNLSFEDDVDDDICFLNC